MSCASAFSGCVLVTINLIFTIIGLAVSAVGGILKWAPDLYTRHLKDVLVSFASKTAGENQEVAKNVGNVLDQIFTFLGKYGIALFVVGLVLVVISLLAVCGVCCKSKWLLGTYAFIVGIIMCGVIAFTIVLFVKKDWVQNLGKDSLTKFVTDNYEGPSNMTITFSGVSGVVDIIQGKFKCCGVTNYKDYDNAKHWNRVITITISGTTRQLNLTAPVSCCKTDDKNIPDQSCLLGANTTNSYMNDGCYTQLWKTIGNNWTYVKYGNIGLSAFMVLLFIFSICAMRFEKEKIDPI